MIEGKSFSAKGVEVLYQAGYEDDGLIPEPAIIIRKYDQDNDVFGIIQGDQEICVGGKKSMLQLAKAIKNWALKSNAALSTTPQTGDKDEQADQGFLEST